MIHCFLVRPVVIQTTSLYFHQCTPFPVPGYINVQNVTCFILITISILALDVRMTRGRIFLFSITTNRWIHNEELNEIGGACSAYGEGRVVYRVLLGKREGKRPLVRPRRRWEDNIKADLQKVGCGDMD
jgi:hypothetical protein